ncbi:MAG: hypothetical protein PHQ86_01215 [Dehalococcoidales bacterium]|nr:hypothetical protein [Dehalococcoidales bacterium]
MALDSKYILSFNPCEVLKPLSLQIYEEKLDLIWQEVMRLNANLLYLEKLLDFPANLFISPEDNFFQLVNVAMTHDSILIITKLWIDKDGRKEGEGQRLNIHHFKEWVRQNLLAQYQPMFDCVLKEIRDDIGYLSSRTRDIKNLRNNFVAHLIFDDNQRFERNTNVSFADLKSICQRINRIFQVLCFNVEHPVLPVTYLRDKQSDIEDYLDLIVRDSAFYKEPESPYWNLNKGVMPPESINLLNKYRRKFGEAEV